jgi:hypothetical protein
MHNGTADYLLTAAHCADFINGIQFSTGANVLLGTNSWTTTLLDYNDLDATLIHINKGTDQFYVGPYNSSSYYTIPGIEPWAQALVGCLSGSVSGVTCGIHRDGTPTQKILIEDCSHQPGCFHVWAFHVTGTGTSQVVAGGDSGGPWYLPSNHYGLGIQSAASKDAEVPCNNKVDPAFRAHDACYTDAYVTPINRVANVLAPHGISVDTN